ncbi:TPA: prepilin-type N-terminal cleavage/methylation domain-containing protein [Enterobacter roggenkampii]
MNRQHGFTLIELMVMIGSKLLLLETHKNQIIDLKQKKETYWSLFIYVNYMGVIFSIKIRYLSGIPEQH